MSDKRERNYYYVRYNTSTLAIGDTLVWNGTEWVNSPAGAGVPGGGDITGAANVGTGEGSVFRDEITGVLNLKTLKQGTNITVTDNTNDVTIAASGGGAGEANTGANVGSGTGTIFRDKTGVTLNLKTLLAGSNVTLTNNANDVTIAAAAGAAGDITGASNVGSGTGQVFRDEVTGVLNLKTILAGTNMTVTNNANDITLASTAAGGSTTLDGLTDVAITSAARGDIIVRDATQFINKTKGTAGQVLTMDGTGTDPLWATPASGGWNASAAETLTNKTIDSDNNIITNIVDADVKAAAGIAKTKLANLDIVNADVNALAGIAWSKINRTGSGISPDVLTGAYGAYNTLSPTGGTGVFAGNLTSGGTHSIDSTTVLRGKWTTGAVSGNQAGIITTKQVTQRSKNHILEFVFVTNSGTSCKHFVGFTSKTTFEAGATYLANEHGIGFYMDTANANLKIIHNDAGATAVQDDFTTPVAIGVAAHKIRIEWDNANTRYVFTYNDTNVKNITTRIPAATNTMNVQGTIETTTTAARQQVYMYLMINQDPLS